MKGLNICVIFITCCFSISGQVQFGMQSMVGFTCAGDKNLINAKSFFGVMPTMSLLNSGHNGVTIGGGFMTVVADEKFISTLNVKYLSLGYTFSPKIAKNRINLVSNGIFGRTKPAQNLSTTPDAWKNNYITWTNWGIQAYCVFNYKKWLGFSLGYTRMIARNYDPGNYQSLVNVGVILRLSWELSEQKL